MNYEKKYKDALERAKEKYAMFEGMKQGDVLEDVFPELKESEDGSIRKAIHIYLDWLDGRKGYEPKGEYSIRDMIAWIEKQGEHKPNDKKGMNLVEEKMTPFQKKVFCIIDTAIEEEQGLKQVCDELLGLAHDEIKQNPAGWSEEDEKMLEKVIKALSAYGDKLQYEGFCHNTEVIQEYIDWLKSLRPQNRWKPSDEQMEALKEAVDEHFDIDGGVLWHLYQDLKKLREE